MRDMRDMIDIMSVILFYSYNFSIYNKV